MMACLCSMSNKAHVGLKGSVKHVLVHVDVYELRMLICVCVWGGGDAVAKGYTCMLVLVLMSVAQSCRYPYPPRPDNQAGQSSRPVECCQPGLPGGCCLGGVHAAAAAAAAGPMHSSASVV